MLNHSMMWVEYVIGLIKQPYISICKMVQQWFITVLIMSHLLTVLLNKLPSLLKHKLLLVVIWRLVVLHHIVIIGILEMYLQYN
nr:putative membrane protein [Neisseria meningitidis 98080]